MDVLSVHQDVAGGGAVEATENLQQCGFAGTRRADDGDALAGANGDRNALQDFEGDRTLAKALMNVAGFENGDSHRVSLMSQGLRGRCAGGAPGGIDRREGTQDEGDA